MAAFQQLMKNFEHPMIAEQLISTAILPLQTSDTGVTALEMMGEFYLRHLPIVNNQQLLGLLEEDDILNYDVNEPIGSYSLSLPRPQVAWDDHIYTIMQVMADLKLTAIPVVDEDQNYLGVILQEDLLRFFADLAGFGENGSIIVLEMSRKDLLISEISRIVESENGNILNLFVTPYPDSARLDVTLKIKAQNLPGILATFQRYDYQIKATFSGSQFSDPMKERLDGFLMYLNV